MQEIKVNNMHSMFQQIEMHMKDILRNPAKRNVLEDIDQKFARRHEVRNAYAIFKDPSKLSVASDNNTIQKSIEPRT